MTKYKYAGVHNLRNPGICIFKYIIYLYFFVGLGRLRFGRLRFGRLRLGRLRLGRLRLGRLRFKHNI